ncbi:hypothetical protein K2Y11_03685 [bacterium]|nr:hypothetical protein [bacterium]
MIKAVDPSKELRLLLAFFGDSVLPKVTIEPPEDVPAPYHQLLVHRGHMTETLERHYNDKVVVHPWVIQRNGEMYGRKLDLTLQKTGEVVMTGLMIFNLSFVKENIKQEILEGKTPLGRILISHNVLREVSTGSYLRIEADDPLVSRFHLTEPKPAYGRLATIFCDEKPAVDLVEIVRP